MLMVLLVLGLTDSICLLVGLKSIERLFSENCYFGTTLVFTTSKESAQNSATDIRLSL